VVAADNVVSDAGMVVVAVVCMVVVPGDCVVAGALVVGAWVSGASVLSLELEE